MDVRIKKGFDIPLAGKPAPEIATEESCSTVAVYPLEFEGMKQRLKVAEGDVVRRGGELMEDKANEAFKLRAPGAGRITSVVRGARRFVEQIVIELDPADEVESFDRYTADQLLTLDRAKILAQLTTTGYLAFIRQRPFSHMANVSTPPKSIFVNAMNTAPFGADAETVVHDDPVAFQAGLDLMTRLTDGAVHLCLAADERGATLRGAQRVQTHTFAGPHPSGNSSLHISRVDPMDPHDVVWTVKAIDLVLIGRLFLDGALPATRIIAVGGPGVTADACRHYRVRNGGNLGPLLSRVIAEASPRVIAGDILSGQAIETSDHLRLQQSAVTVIAEDTRRRFLGWTSPSLDQFSFMRLLPSTWLRRSHQWSLGSNLNGGLRAMVLTGHYDKVMPLNIMVDYLLRAVLAGDTDESIALGILETDPEDFALCEFICPSKVNLQAIIRRGLDAIEEEGV
ncbi:MAG: Na(+)-translocating NADH-quinone reductase subunit A [Lentisphaerae bacterium]|nr:Na(+)-translocating NADH-quinone reductase subunit A [Lentisphaerota bacterium]